MSDKKHGPERDDSKSLNSTEYRHRLLNKLNCLIAVLEVAIGKITKTMSAEDTNQDRLVRIKSNLENTLSICRRAKSTLESKLREETPANAEQPPAVRPKKKDSVSFRCYVELSSIEEFRKFKDLPAITGKDIQDTDLDQLLGRLLEEE